MMATDESSPRNNLRGCGAFREKLRHGLGTEQLRTQHDSLGGCCTLNRDMRSTDMQGCPGFDVCVPHQQ